MTAAALWQAAWLAALAIPYFVIAVFRSAYAELNPVSSARILSAHGLEPREGELPGDVPPVMRMTFDLTHQAVLILASVLSYRMSLLAGLPRPLLWAVVGMLPAMVLIQVLARGIALSDPERAFSSSLTLLRFLYHLLRPVVAPIAWGLRRVRRLGRDRRAATGADEEAAEEQIEAFIDAGQQEGILEAEEGHLIRQVVEFHDSVVREAMTPRTDVVAIPGSATLAEARAVFARERHSRLPVYRDQIDNVEGIVTLKDLIASWDRLPEDSSIASLMRPAYFVPATKQVSDLLREFQARRIQMAIVVDEYGGTAGVITLEDLLEELVGEIREEHEKDETPVTKESEGAWMVLGTAGLDELGAAVGMELEAEGFETVSGLIYSVLGRIPRRGETVEVNGLRLEIVEADRRRIDRVRVTRPAQSQAL